MCGLNQPRQGIFWGRLACQICIFFVMHNFSPWAFLKGQYCRWAYISNVNLFFTTITGLHLSLVIILFALLHRIARNSLSWNESFFSPFLFLISTNVTEVLLGVFFDKCMLIGLTNVLHSPNSSMLNHGLFIIVFYWKGNPLLSVLISVMRVCWNIVDLQLSRDMFKLFAAKTKMCVLRPGFNPIIDIDF